MGKGINIYKRWALGLAGGLGIIFVIFVYNQTSLFVSDISAVSPLTGRLVLMVLLAFYGFVFLVPIIGLYRLPKSPDLPEDASDETYEAYLAFLADKLAQNKRVQAYGMREVKTEADILDAYDCLREEADYIIRKEATSVFLTTAVSQNGSLDALFMLASSTKMVWHLMHLYETRPSLKRMAYLYGSIASTALLARTIEDMDLIEDQLEPLVGSLLGGSLLNLVPGTQAVTNMIVSSITEGSINSLLTLRVGSITKQYMTALTRPQTKHIRRQASMDAARMLPGILKNNALAIMKSFGRSVKSATKSTFGF